MIPFVDLKAQYLEIGEEIEAAIRRVLESTQFILGREVAAFEEAFADYCDTQYAIAVNSGTSALHLALLAADVGPGDEVITVPFTFIATGAAVRYLSAQPVFVDIDPKSYTMDPNQIEAVITEKTKAILPVHLYGHPVDMDPIMTIAEQHGLVVVEDAAQAHGAEYKGQKVGGIGDLGCFSFYPGKNLGAYGEGGMVVTDNPDYARKIRMLRDWGQETKYHHEFLGFNYRMDGFQGAILRTKLDYLDQWTRSRRAIANAYRQMLQESDVVTPEEAAFVKHVYHIFAIRVSERDPLMQHLRAQGVHCGIHYPIPLHLQKPFHDLPYQLGDFPISELAAAEVVSLPMFPELKPGQVEQVVFHLREFLLAKEKV